MDNITNDKIKAYTDEMPPELRRVIDALNDDLGLAAFIVLFKYGEMPFSQIMSELDIPTYNSIKLLYQLEKLQKSALVKNEYIKTENVDVHSFYDVNEFGETMITNLMNTFRIDKDREPSKNLVFGSPEKFKTALDEILEENKEGLERLRKS